MEFSRRDLLKQGGIVSAAGFSGCLGDSCDVACFSFTFEGFDDAPSWLTIRHTEGKDLPANEVYITGRDGATGEYTNINTSSSSVGGVMKPWYKLDDELGPNDGIAGAVITRTDFQPKTSESTDSFEVLVVWKTDNETKELGSWLRTWQGYDG
jgi:hypothetical protein